MRFQPMRRGLLLVLSAPSGGGKSAVLKRLLAEDTAITYSVSYTSRPKRGAEVDGINYHFVAREEFARMADEGSFYEYAEVHGNLYGTSAKAVEEALDSGQDVAMDVDIQGGLAIKKRDSGAVLTFLMPPSMKVLESRLRGRDSDSEDQIRLRMANASAEIEHWRDYDYVVMNEDLERAVAEVRRIVQAERLAVGRSEINQIEDS